MTWCSKLQIMTLGFTTLCVGLWVPPSLAQTSPTTTFDAKTVDIFDTTEGESFDPLDIIHKANFSREDPFSFFQRQQNNLNSEFSDFRSRQLEQLRDQGYEPPSLSPNLATEGVVPAGQGEVLPKTQEVDSSPLLRIDLPEGSLETPTLAPDPVTSP
jgi:hypothetical protein